MAKVRLSQRARKDLLHILERLSDVAGPRTARKYDTEIKRTLRRVGRFPGTGSPRPQFGAETRTVSVAPYLNFYDGGPKSETVHVLRILHGRRDITPGLISTGRER
jgi:plasmid stabilization system protein ParE